MIALLLHFIEEFDGVVTDEVEGRRIGSTAGIPTKVSKSANIADFKRTSSGLSQPKDGDKLTSNSQGFKVSSINISKPYNSTTVKIRIMYHFYFCVTYQSNYLCLEQTSDKQVQWH